MNATLRKELRIVWLPLAIACAAAFVCGGASVTDPVGHTLLLSKLVRIGVEWCPGILCISLGILTTLVFGAEYQHRTLPLLLAQPISRAKIWNQKSAMLGACAILIVATWFIGSQMSLHYHWGIATYSEGETRSMDDVSLSFGAFFLATLCSATFWSLMARSVIGGIVLNGGFQALTGLCVALVAERFFKIENAWRVVICAAPFYAGIFLMLGRRQFMRLQVASAFDAGPGRTESFAALKMDLPALRPTRHRALINLIRKEVRLNKPLFVIAGLFVVVWFLSLLVCSAANADAKNTSSILAGIIAVYVCIILGLGGSISLGEEKSLGVHAAQLVLPVPRWKLWGTKVTIAFAICTLLGLVLPIVLALSIPPAVQPFEISNHTFEIMKWTPLYVCAAFIIVGFWAATHFQNSVFAVLCTVLFFPAVFFSAVIGNLIANHSDGFQHPILAHLTFKYHLSPLYFQRAEIVEDFFLYLAGVLCAVLLLQSVKVFGVIQPAMPRVFRHALVVFVVSILGVTWFCDFQKSSSKMFWFVTETKQGLARAIPKTEVGRAIDEVHEVVLPLQQLEETGELSKRSAQWLRGSKITIRRTTFARSKPLEKVQKGYLAEVVFPHDSNPNDCWFITIRESNPE